MSGPPPGYNPLESTLQGGTNVPITPVQGGGGGMLQTNPDQSLLSGGNDVPIHGVQGGGAENPTTVIASVEFPVVCDDIYKCYLSEQLDKRGIDPTTGNYKSNIFGNNTNTAKKEGLILEAKAKAEELFSKTLNDTAAPSTAAVPKAVSGKVPRVPKSAPAPTTTAAAPTAATAIAPTTAAAPDPAPAPTAAGSKEVGLKSINIDMQPNIPSPARTTSDDLHLPEYVKKRRALWKIINVDGQENTSQQPTIFSYENITNAFRQQMADDRTGQGAHYRLAVFLKESTQLILKLPAIKGNWEAYQSCITYLKDNGILENKKAVVIFSWPFYGENVANNTALLLDVTKLILNSKADIYVTAQHTIFNYVKGSEIQEAIYQKSLDTKAPLLNMLEPTYVVYPFDRSMNAVSINGFIFTGAAPEGEEAVPASKVSSKKASIGLAIEKIGARDLKSFSFPPELSLRDEYIEDAIPKWRIETLHTVADTLSEGGAPPLTAFEYRFYSEKLPTFSEGVEAKYRFVGSDPRALEKGNLKLVPIELAGKAHAIRSGVDDDVMDDWKKGLFTADEAEFLNDLNLRPAMMREIFGDSATTEVANFLYSLGVSECFKSTMFLSHMQCEGARNFVNKVYAYFLSHSDEISGLSESEKEDIEGELRERANRADIQVKDALRTSNTEITTLIDELSKIKKYRGDNPGDTSDEIRKKLEKDPFEDGVLTETGASSVPLGTQPVFPDAKVQGRYTRYVLAMSRNKPFQHSELTVDDVKDEADARQKLQVKFDQLVKDYPSYYFIS